MAKERRFYVASPVDHDGTRFDVGSEIVLTDAAADPLLAVNAISSKKPAVTEPDPVEPPPPAA